MAARLQEQQQNTHRAQTNTRKTFHNFLPQSPDLQKHSMLSDFLVLDWYQS